MSVIAGSPTRRACDQKRLSPGHKSLDAELYGLGRTLKHLQPPGGNENGVFDAYRLPPEILTPRKKVKDYLRSHVFDVEIQSPPSSRPITPASESTHEHLFPTTPSKPIPALHDNLKSTVFDPDPPKNTPILVIKRNPITGESCISFDDPVTPKIRKIRNPLTFEGVPQNAIKTRCTQPPGGKCSLVLEYNE